MGTKADGHRLLREAQTKYEIDRIDRETYEAHTKHAISLIAMEDKKEAERIAKAYGYNLKNL